MELVGIADLARYARLAVTSSQNGHGNSDLATTEVCYPLKHESLRPDIVGGWEKNSQNNKGLGIFLSSCSI